MKLPYATPTLTELTTCHDCGAKPFTLHGQGCDVERCPMCGGQLISCGCCYKHFYPTYDHTPNGTKFAGLPAEVYENGLSDDQESEWSRVLTTVGRDPWTGIWPGAREATEFGWFCRWADPPGRGWVRCEAGDPGAGPDLNRLHGSEARWDVEKKRWVLR